MLLVTSNKASKKKDKSIIVTCALLVMFVTSIANLAVQWKVTNLCFIENGQSILSAFICNTNAGQTGYQLAVGILSDLQFSIADGLLVMSILVNII